MNPAAHRRFLSQHRSLLADRVRTESYRRAIAQTVKKGDTVLDLGTGSGILVFLALQAGAEKVYAIEAGPMVEVAKQVCRANGFEGRAIFLKGFSHRVDLPERVDVIVTETLGNFGLEEGFLGSIIDARKRFLKKKGIIIPRSLQVWVAPVVQPRTYRKINFWSKDLYGVDFSRVRSFAANNFYSVILSPREFLSRPALLAEISSLGVGIADPQNEVSFTVGKSGILHGIGGWFRAELVPGLALSNAPPNRARSWGNAFLPLKKPVSVKKGDRLKVRITSSRQAAIWSWQVECGGERLDQSTFFGFPL